MAIYKDIQTVKFMGFIIVSFVTVKLCTIFSLNRKSENVKKFYCNNMAALERDHNQRPSR